MTHKLQIIDQQVTGGGIRGLVDAVDREVCLIKGSHPDGSAALAQSWAALVVWLALAPAPITRSCPTCAKIVMRDAVTCGYCWTRLTLLD